MVTRKGREENSAKAVRVKLLSLGDFLELYLALRSLCEKYSSSTSLKKWNAPCTL